MSGKPQKQVHPAASALFILLTLFGVNWIWWRFLVYREPLKPAPPGGGGAANRAAALNLVGRTDVEVVTFAGDQQPGTVDGPGHAARFDRPTGLAMDRSGGLYVADTGNNRIRRISPEGDTSTVTGGEAGFVDGPLAQARFNAPCGVCVGSDDAVYVADTGNGCIRRISGGQVTTLTGAPGARSGRSPLAPPANHDSPAAVALSAGPTPLLLVANAGLGKVTRYRQDGTVESEHTGPGRPVAVFGSPEAVAWADTGTLMMGSQMFKNTPIQTDDPASAELAAKLGLHHPVGISHFGTGWLVTDNGHSAVLLVVNGKAQILAGYCSTAGPIRGNRDGTGATCLLGSLCGLASDGKRFAFVSDTSNNLIRRLDLSSLAGQ